MTRDPVMSCTSIRQLRPGVESGVINGVLRPVSPGVEWGVKMVFTPHQTYITSLIRDC